MFISCYSSMIPATNAALERLAHATNDKGYSMARPLQALVMVRVKPTHVLLFFLKIENKSAPL